MPLKLLGAWKDWIPVLEGAGDLVRALKGLLKGIYRVRGSIGFRV